MRISEHAKKRGKERAGLKPSALENTFKKALKFGARIQDLNGSARGYFENLCSKHDQRGSPIYYGNLIYIYDFNNKVLITVLWAEKEHLKALDKVVKLKRENKQERTKSK